MALIEEGAHFVANLKFGNPRAYGEDIASAIGAGDTWQFHGERIVPGCDYQVPVVQRDSLNLDKAIVVA